MDSPCEINTSIKTIVVEQAAAVPWVAMIVVFFFGLVIAASVAAVVGESNTFRGKKSTRVFLGAVVAGAAMMAVAAPLHASVLIVGASAFVGGLMSPALLPKLESRLAKVFAGKDQP